MITIYGKYTNAIVYTTDNEQYAIDDYARSQLQMICDHPSTAGSKIRVMPDVHPGKVGTIGLTMTVGSLLLPNLVGVDIGCGMTCVKLNKSNVEFQKLDKVIRENVPAGFTIRREPHHMAGEFSYETLHCAGHINKKKAERSLGTLGGGNHFIELDRAEDGSVYLVVHTGSRHLGEEVAEYYTKLAARSLRECGGEVPYYMSYLEGENKEAYLEDVTIIQKYAQWNREIIVREILKGMKWKALDQFSVPHNYLDESGILRKGSISARKGESVIIPVNMRDGVLLGIGKGNHVHPGLF